MATEEVSSRDMAMGEDSVPIPDELRELQTELINLNTKLVFAVATCDCENKEECDVYKNSKEIAKVLKKMQDVITITTKSTRKKSRRQS